jgi:PPM family protein phosphatase
MVVPDPDTPVPPPALRWSAAGLSDIGRVRRRNEDALLLDPAGLFAVADGMGGHAAGDVASRLAVSTLAASPGILPGGAARQPGRSGGTDEIADEIADAIADALVAAFNRANRAILDHAATERACRGMGTTLTALVPLARAPACVIGHVGDSRAYRLRDGTMEQLTRDHTWVQHQVDTGMLTPHQARHHGRSAVLLRVLGTELFLPADIVVVDAKPGDMFLLCSDGLTEMLEDDDIRQLLDVGSPLADLAAALVSETVQRGARDNVTVLVLSVGQP